MTEQRFRQCLIPRLLSPCWCYNRLWLCQPAHTDSSPPSCRYGQELCMP